jgi:hypothetical protein
MRRRFESMISAALVVALVVAMYGSAILARSQAPRTAAAISDEVIKMVNGGVDRVKKFCADRGAKGNYMAGCPAQVK